MRVCSYLVLIVSLCVGGPLRAHGDAESDAAAQASERFQRGVALFREGAFRAALIEFERAYDLKPHYRLYYNIGQAHLELGDYLEAIESLQLFIEQGGGEIEPSKRQVVEQKLAGLRGRVALVSVSVSVEGADIYIDDKLVGTSPVVRAVSVNVGRHRVSVRGSGGATASEVIDVAGGDVRELHFELDPVQVAPLPASPAPPVVVVPPVAVSPADERPTTRSHKVAVGCLIASGALGVGSVIALVLQRRQSDVYEKEVNKEGASANLVASANEKAWRSAVAVDVLGGLALASAAAGLVIWWVKSGKDKPAQARVGLGVTASQLLLQGNF